MSKLRHLLFLTFVSAGCAASSPTARTSSPDAPTAPAEAPAKAQALTPREAFAREVTSPLPRVAVKAEEAPFEGEVLAAGAPSVRKRPNGVVILSVPVGTAEPIICFFYPSAIDAGAAARNLVQSLLDEVTVERVRATDVQSLGGSPALYLDSDFTQGTGSAVVVGRLKLMVHADPVLPKSCFHDEPGYAETFRRVTGSVATGLRSTAQEVPVAPYFSDVHAIRMGGQVLGFQYQAFFRAREGGVIVEASTTLVRPGGPTELQFQDTNLTEHSDAAGLLVSKSYSKRVNDDIPIQVSLRRDDTGGYSVEGKAGGKDVKARVDGALVGEVGVAARLRQELLEDGMPVEAQMWLPPSNPAAPTKVVFRPRDGAGARAATMEVGALNVQVTLDAQGLVERMEMPAGSAAVVQARVAQRNEP